VPVLKANPVLQVLPAQKVLLVLQVNLPPRQI
jgi:hypothetical protein